MGAQAQHFNTILLMLMLIMLSSVEFVTFLPSQVADSRGGKQGFPSASLEMLYSAQSETEQDFPK